MMATKDNEIDGYHSDPPSSCSAGPTGDDLVGHFTSDGLSKITRSCYDFILVSLASHNNGTGITKNKCPYMLD